MMKMAVDRVWCCCDVYRSSSLRWRYGVKRNIQTNTANVIKIGQMESGSPFRNSRHCKLLIAHHQGLLPSASVQKTFLASWGYQLNGTNLASGGDAVVCVEAPFYGGGDWRLCVQSPPFLCSWENHFTPSRRAWLPCLYQKSARPFLNLRRTCRERTLFRPISLHQFYLRVTLLRWSLTSTQECDCGVEEQTVDDVLLTRPIYRASNGIRGLENLDDDSTACHWTFVLKAITEEFPSPRMWKDKSSALIWFGNEGTLRYCNRMEHITETVNLKRRKSCSLQILLK